MNYKPLLPFCLPKDLKDNLHNNKQELDIQFNILPYDQYLKDVKRDGSKFKFKFEFEDFKHQDQGKNDK